MSSYNGKLNNFAKDLRRNMTKEERRLWYEFLRNHPLHFYKQRIIGNYIADFYCPAAHLVIELDGSQHYENTAILKDNERTRYFESRGLTVLRIPNNYIKENFRGVCEYIGVITSQSPKGDSSP